MDDRKSSRRPGLVPPSGPRARASRTCRESWKDDAGSRPAGLAVWRRIDTRRTSVRDKTKLKFERVCQRGRRSKREGCVLTSACVPCSLLPPTARVTPDVVKFSSGYHPHGIPCSCKRATYRERGSEDGTTPASDHDPIALCSDLEGRSGRRHRAAYTHTDDSHHATNRRLSPNAATCTPCVLIYILTNTLEPPPEIRRQERAEVHCQASGTPLGSCVLHILRLTVLGSFRCATKAYLPPHE